MLLALLACTGPTPDTSSPGDSQDTQDSADPVDTANQDWDTYNGDEPDEHVPLPSFASVLDSSGEARTPADLEGHPTVIWFYPAAGTFG
jgi:hypothetical protein